MGSVKLLFRCQRGWSRGVLLSLGLLGTVTVGAAEAALLDRALEAWKAGRQTNALALVDQAVMAGPKDLRALNFRAQMRGLLGRHADAVSDLTTALALEPDSAWLYHARGEQRFKAGEFEASCADFAKADALAPQKAAHNWQRGIALYYAGRYDEGRKLFELHRSVNPQDVENAAWHFLCAARMDGVEKARAQLIPVNADGRVPMKEVQGLFAGKVSPDEVFQAAETGSEGDRPGQRFFAHLYVGLFHEAAGRKEAAEEHIRKAAALARAGGYMGDVARVHARLFDAPTPKTPPVKVAP